MDDEIHLDYVAGVLDGCGTITIKINKTEGSPTGYHIQPIAEIRRRGEKSIFGLLDEFCDLNNISSEVYANDDEVVWYVHGITSVRSLLLTLDGHFQRLAPDCELLLGDLLPRLEADEHESKAGFLSVVFRSEFLSHRQQYSHNLHYDYEYFDNAWNVNTNNESHIDNSMEDTTQKSEYSIDVLTLYATETAVANESTDCGTIEELVDESVRALLKEMIDEPDGEFPPSIGAETASLSVQIDPQLVRLIDATANSSDGTDLSEYHASFIEAALISALDLNDGRTTEVTIPLPSGLLRLIEEQPESSVESYLQRAAKQALRSDHNNS
ncbi:MAG: hypothetical protein IH933_06335 [Euryarchaeota archaeon]|jgi:hypothetical protein|nr:hypothetical protein [Euryarchaeota archaeon]